jgi:hypothetical protein
VISLILRIDNIFFIKTYGANEPAIIPVLKLAILYLEGSD